MNSTKHLKAGFTLTELMIYLVIAALVMGSVVKLMVNQSRSYANQRGLTDVRETLRAGSALLAWELRTAALGGSPFSAIGAQSITLRSVQGMGSVCGRASGVSPYYRFGLWGTSGDIEATADDSALIWQSGQQRWHAVKIHAMGTPAAMGVPLCTWTGKAIAPTTVVEIQANQASDSSNVFVGATFRSYRSVTYSVIASGGRNWLGRQVGAGAATQLTGPLLAAGANGGLTFAYWDTLGAVVALPGNVANIGQVQYTLRAQSWKQYRNPNSGVVGYRQDSLTTKVMLRR
jgi:hypothetical protein